MLECQATFNRVAAREKVWIAWLVKNQRTLLIAYHTLSYLTIYLAGLYPFKNKMGYEKPVLRLFVNGKRPCGQL